MGLEFKPETDRPMPVVTVIAMQIAAYPHVLEDLFYGAAHWPVKA